MKLLKCLGASFFILFFTAGILSCSTAKGQLKREPAKESLSKPAGEVAPPIPTLSPEKEKILANEKEAVPKQSKPAEPRTPASRSEGFLPPPSPIPPSSAPAAKRPPESISGSKFVLNFDNADLYEVIRVMGNMMKMNYIIDQKVRGIVNIHTAGQLNTEEIFPLFQSILKLNGATAVKKGTIYEIVPLGEAKKLYTPPTTFRESGKIQPEEKYTIQIITLKYIPVNEVSKMIKPFLS
ncbi:MAG: hypothetical protein OEW45_22100, partial [Deltaproteobacteria bacterium]|nr:hypothetical protein [Deltaproteobacteria bacterium]